MTNERKVFDFQDQLKLGAEGEARFKLLYHSELEYIKERYADFKRVSDGAVLELKTDKYNHDETANFFIERWSNVDTKKPGSFWQSIPKGATLFCYYFPSHACYYEFTDLPKVLQRLDDIIDSGQVKPIRVLNKGWTGVGYKIPREILKEFWSYYEANSNS